MLRYFAAFIAWNITVDLSLLLLPPLASMPLALALTAAFLWGYLLRGPRPRRHWAALRLRPPRRRALPWVAAAIPVFLAFVAALGELYVRIVPVPPENLDIFRDLMNEPAGRLAVTLRAVVFASVLEEMVFRGLIQRRLERRWGLAAALATTSLLFALVHLLPRLLPMHFFLGLAFGYAVFVTRSIWTGVILHAANNAAAMLGMGLRAERPEQLPTIWETGATPEWWLSLAATLTAGAALAFVARGLWRVAPARLRRASAHG